MITEADGTAPITGTPDDPLDKAGQARMADLLQKLARSPKWELAVAHYLWERQQKP